jgi:hypothetical protein
MTKEPFTEFKYSYFVKLKKYRKNQRDTCLLSPYWPSKELQRKGLNVIHFWHDKEFKMFACVPSSLMQII